MFGMEKKTRWLEVASEGGAKSCLESVANGLN